MLVYRLEYVVGLPAAGSHDITVRSDFLQQKVRLINHLRSTINDPEHFDDDDTAGITCLECLRDTFAYDPEACFGQAPKVNEFENLYTVTVPFTC